MFVDLISPIARRRGVFDFRKEFRKIVHLERRLMLLQERHHLARDVALVEAIARGDDARRPPSVHGVAFGLDHQRQRARERRQLDRLAGLVHRTVRLEPVALVIRPFLEEREIASNRLHRPGAQRETLLRVLDGPG